MKWTTKKEGLIKELEAHLIYLMRFNKKSNLRYLICFDYNGHLSDTEKKNLDRNDVNFIYVDLKNLRIS